jgi:hypothetical protein
LILTQCVTTGSFSDRLEVGGVYSIFEIDLERMRIRVQDNTSECNWYPAELFGFDLLECTDDEKPHCPKQAGQEVLTPKSTNRQFYVVYTNH